MMNKSVTSGHHQPMPAKKENSGKRSNLHLDLDNLLKNLDSEVSIVMDLLKIIPKQLLNDLNSLEESILRNNVSGLKYSIHNLIGISLNMYFNQLTELAKLFELEIENNNHQVLNELLGEMILEVKLVEQEIRNFEMQRADQTV